jgi:phage shock protein PspC (stress-responsive transcriptional regulator)
MNGNGRLYRGTSDAMLGGVAAGLGAYFKVDPTIIRIIFLLLAFVTGGGFVLVYLALWLLLPTAGSTATEANQVIQENLNEMGAKFRGFTGPRAAGGTTPAGETPTMANGGGTAGANPGPQPNMTQAQLPQGGGAATRPRHGANPQVLIWIGVFFLLVNLGIFRGIHWAMWWPLLLIGLGAIMIMRRNP